MYVDEVFVAWVGVRDCDVAERGDAGVRGGCCREGCFREAVWEGGVILDLDGCCFDMLEAWDGGECKG